MSERAEASAQGVEEMRIESHRVAVLELLKGVREQIVADEDKVDLSKHPTARAYENMQFLNTIAQNPTLKSYLDRTHGEVRVIPASSFGHIEQVYITPDDGAYMLINSWLAEDHDRISDLQEMQRLWDCGHDISRKLINGLARLNKRQLVRKVEKNLDKVSLARRLGSIF